MNDDSPFPPALPAVVPSPLGPAISYSNIRAVTSRAERTLEQIEKKIRKRLQAGLNESGMVGAVAEHKVRQLFASQLAPAEQLFEELVTLIQNQIAANLAPAVATLEDLQGTDESLQRASPMTQTAGVGTPAARPPVPPVETPLTPSLRTRAVGLERQLQRATGQVAGGPRIQQPQLPPPPANKCDPPDEVESDRLKKLAWAYRDTLPVDPAQIYLDYDYTANTNCCVCIGRVGAVDCPGGPDTFLLFFAGPPLQAGMIQPMTSYLQKQWKPNAQCGITPPVDCTTHPLDPSCPPDCKTHPEDPRCPVTPPTCPPPCIEVTCPPPIINVPPCPSLTPTSCVQIDLCDYDKFCKFIKDCLVQAKEDCALDNDTAYTFKDCDGSYGEGQRDFLGAAGKPLLDAASFDDIVSQVQLQTADLTADDFSTGAPY